MSYDSNFLFYQEEIKLQTKIKKLQREGGGSTAARRGHLGGNRDDPRAALYLSGDELIQNSCQSRSKCDELLGIKCML